MLSPEQFAVVIKTLTESQAYQRGAWAKVVEEGRKYGQMKAFGTYIGQNGGNVSLCHSDRERTTKYFGEDVLHAVEIAFAEDAQMGIAVSKATA